MQGKSSQNNFSENAYLSLTKLLIWETRESSHFLKCLLVSSQPLEGFLQAFLLIYPPSPFDIAAVPRHLYPGTAVSSLGLQAI